VSSYLENYKTRLNILLNLIEIDVLEQVVICMINAFKNGNIVYVAGNGGSVVTVSHMQADFSFFMRYFTKFRPRMIALTDNVPLMTTIGNDNSFEDILSRK